MKFNFVNDNGNGKIEKTRTKRKLKN